MIERRRVVVAQNVAKRMPDNFDAKHQEQPDQSKSTQDEATAGQDFILSAKGRSRKIAYLA